MFSELDTENNPMLSQSDGSLLQALGTGDVPVIFADKDGDIINVTLKHVALIPNAANNLISSKRLMESNHMLFLWNRPGSEIVNLNNGIAYSVVYKDGFHYLMDMSDDSKLVNAERRQM
ncbi:hypothetical protein JRQ81_001416 [Phrynocephalus forsythii]|uniref:Retrovirus-related Pol polyprotein from transposon TNT 1-94-like beta-barrel domain-containing protein n=1 Tax=Phrynocephalus forsythii TaxID=171643 RepID=A0A9Q1B917_9SAUR|nr:hypothetical protein JRQ81_001416 [Phrynocephalus forsythii]